MALSSFSRGDIIWCDFQRSPQSPNYTITGRHMAVILSDDILPNHTVIVSPITSWVLKDPTGKIVLGADKKPVRKKLQEFHHGLEYANYPGVLQHDSYIKLDQIYTFTRQTLKGRIIGSLSGMDKIQVDLKLITVFQMFETIKKLIEANVKKEV